jgi:hypothetical protein
MEGKKSINKRAQVALIIIVAVVLVGGLVSVVVFRDNLGFGGEGSFAEAGEINRELSNCFEQRAVDAVRLVGLQGGYVDLPKDYVGTEISSIAYGVRNGRDVLIDVEDMEEEIESYLEVTLPFCIDDNEYVGLDIEISVADVNVDVNSDEVSVSSKVPISVVKDGESFTLDGKNKVNLDVRLGDMHRVASEIVDRHIRDSEYIDLSYLTSLDYDVVFVPYDDTRLIYTITDSDNELREVPYSFLIVVG